MPFENWDVTRRELARALLCLDNGEFLILGEPVASHVPGPHPIPTRYVQVLRCDEVLSAECVGAASLGGVWEMDVPTIEALRLLGWQTPAESEAQHGLQTPNFDLYVELVSLPDLADLLITSLQVLDALPHELELQTPAA
jgi:hypothetical protein